MLQCIAVNCGDLPHNLRVEGHAQNLGALNIVFVSPLLMQCVAVRCNELQCVAVCCSVLQCIAVRCMHTRHLRKRPCINPLFRVTPLFLVATKPFSRHFSMEGRARHIAACCSVLQHVAVCSSAMQHVAVCSIVMQCVAVCCSGLQCVAVCCSVLQCVAVCCSVLQCVEVCYSVL